MNLLRPDSDTVTLGYQTKTFTGASTQMAASVSTLGKKVSTIAQNADSIGLKVENLTTGMSHTLQVAEDGVTITDANGNAVMISGGQIAANSITADKVNLTGSISFSDLDAAAQNTINSKPDASTVTLITANAISTASISANQITAGTFTGSTLNLDGLLTIQNYGSVGGGIGGANGSRTYGAVLTDFTGSNGILATNAGAKLFSPSFELSVHASGITSYGSLWPGVSGAYNLGSSNFRWNVVYAASSDIITSDREKKNSIHYGLGAYEELYRRLRPVSYKFNDGTSGRTHLGFISQDVEASLEDSKLTSLDFAGFIKSPKLDENGETMEGKYDYALRYEEFIALNTHMIQQLMARVDALENEK
jgi:hypothetical protein